jgi:signal transduction histidine kinase
MFFLVSVLMSNKAAANDNIVDVKLKPYVDSMKQLLTIHPITDIRMMEIYSKIADTYHSFDYDSSVFYAHKSLRLAQKHKATVTMIGIYSTLGLNYSFGSNYDSAFFYFNRMKELAKAGRDVEKETKALSMIAFTYAKQGKYHTSIEYYLNVLKISESEGWTDRCIGILSNLSEINRRLGNTESAMQYLKQAEEKCNTLVYRDRYNWHKSQICNEYAYNYLNKGDPDNALRYALESDSLNPLAPVNASYVNGLLSTIYLQKNDCDLALQYALKAYDWADVLKDKNLYANAGKILSDVYMAQQRYREAETEALKVWMTDSTYIDESRDAVGNIVLANIYMRNMERAAYYFKKYAELNAQYAEKSFQTTVSDLAVKYEIEKKETRIATLEKERQLYTGLGVLGILLVAFLCVVFLQKHRNVRKEKQLIATRSILYGEMKERERLARDLHDRLSGNLSALKIELGKHAETMNPLRDQLDRCIQDIRDAAHNLMPASLQYGMKVALQDFAAQFPNVRFHFYGAEKRMDSRMEFVVYCCANELVNNAVNHSGAKTINLQLVQDSKHVTLTISDDGCGFDEQTVVKGFGLRSMSDRVASCNGNMDIFSEPGKGTEITIELKINN